MNGDRPRRPLAAFLLGTATLLLAGCGSSGSGQSGSAFVFLQVVGFAGPDGTATVRSSLDDVGSPTVGCVRIQSALKNPTVTVTTPLDNVVIESYTVTYPLEGLGPFVFNTAVLIPTDAAQTFPVILVTPDAKRAPPLRPLPRLPNLTTATVVFRGRDGRGQRVAVEAAVTVLFVAEGTDTQPTCG